MKIPSIILLAVLLVSCGQGRYSENSINNDGLPGLKSIGLNNRNQFEGDEEAEVQLSLTGVGENASNDLVVAVDFVARDEESNSSSFIGVSHAQVSAFVPVGGCGKYEGQKYPVIVIRDFENGISIRYFLDQDRSSTYYTMESDIDGGASDNQASATVLSNIRIPFVSYVSHYDKNDLADLSLTLGEVYRSQDEFYGELYTLSVVISNLGTRPAFIDGIYYASDDDSFFRSRQRYVRSRCLMPGDSFISALEFGQGDIDDLGYLILDHEDLIPESNESNNKSDYIDWGVAANPQS